MGFQVGSGEIPQRVGAVSTANEEILANALKAVGKTESYAVSFLPASPCKVKINNGPEQMVNYVTTSVYDYRIFSLVIVDAGVNFDLVAKY